MKLSRRHFLETAGLATAAVSLAKPASLLAQEESSGMGKQPAAIARLKSRKGEAKPITVAEREQRI